MKITPILLIAYLILSALMIDNSDPFLVEDWYNNR
jgi:hypothetical protein